MINDIKSENYRTGEIDMYEWWYLTYPFEQYRAIMQATAERYMRIDEGDCVENLSEAIYALERLKEKEIERTKKNTKTLKEAFVEILDRDVKPKNAGQYLDEIYYHHDDLLKRLRKGGYDYLARDLDGELWVFGVKPKKEDDSWDAETDYHGSIIENDNFPEIQWTDDEPTKITDLLESYENSRENGKVGERFE